MNNPTCPTLYRYALQQGVFAFSTMRQGGCSTGNYSGFNANHYCGDLPEHVSKNRQQLCEWLAIDDSRLILPHQTHHDRVLDITNDWFNLSSVERCSSLEGIDAVVTNLKRVCVAVSTADCIPVLLFDSLHGVVAAVHAGWRGTVQRIVETTLRKMMCSYGTKPSCVHAVIGPGISLQAFEVGDEVYDAFSEAGFEMERIAKRFPSSSQGDGEKWHIDLWEANRQQLLSLGVLDENIQVAGICTYFNYEDFFSARRLGIKSGRIVTGIMME